MAACSRGVPLRTSLASRGSRTVCCNHILKYAASCVSGASTRGTKRRERQVLWLPRASRPRGGRAGLVGSRIRLRVCRLFGSGCGLSFYQGGTRWPYWLAAAVIFALVAFYRPSLLAPLNRLWSKLGLVLFAVVSPLVLGIVYYGCITPVGWLMRLSGKDPLRLRFEPERKSYWEARRPPGPPPDSLMKQF